MSVLLIVFTFALQNKEMDARTRIVETASRLFYTNGYSNTGINQVIKEAEVAKATMYQYFPSKEDLLVEYLTNNAAVTNYTLNQIIAGLYNPKEKVERVFDFLIRFSNATQCNGCHFLNISAEFPQAGERVSSLVKTQKDSIRLFFENILNGNKALADQIYILFDGALMCSKIQKSIWPIESAKQVALKLIEIGL